MILIRQAGETAWRAPATNSYTDERALQDLIARSPTLIPGAANTPIAVVRELSVPGIGYIDVVGVDPNGDITVIECKLKANPEIRRQIIGQVLAYAAGLWGMSYEAFDAAFATVAHQPLADQVRSLSVGDWDEEAFRSAVAANLAKGRFRLVIVVDAITDELKRIVLYLNQHTGADMQILALELGYIADKDTEILVPKAYGEESAQPKEPGARRRWAEDTLFARLDACCRPDGMAALRTLYAWLNERGARLYWGDSMLPWVSAQFPSGNKQISIVSIGEWPENRGAVSINFEYLRGVVSVEVLARLANQLRAVPGMREIYANLETKGYRQRPNLPINQILIQPTAVTVIEQALDELLQAMETERE
jgi:hypothetical protein